MAGIGRGCPHQNFGQTSCIRGGRIDSSCCVDSHFHQACHYKPNINGVVCCKLPSKYLLSRGMFEGGGWMDLSNLSFDNL